MKASFTGTRRGMSEKQRVEFHAWAESVKSELAFFSHGGCEGSDIDAHTIVRRVCGKSVYIACFPSTANTRCRCLPGDVNFVATPKEPLSRNVDIIRAGPDILVATPLQLQEVLRSGTWHAIRCARKIHVPVKIFQRY